MKGGMVRSRPRAISDHVLIKWRPEKPSAAWCCMPTPREAPPHLKKVTYMKEYFYIKYMSKTRKNRGRILLDQESSERQN